MKSTWFRSALILFATAFFLPVVQAQIPMTKEDAPKIIDPYYTRLSRSYFVALPVTNTDVVSGVQEKLKELSPHLNDPLSGFNLQHDITSPGGRHLTFEQTFNSFPVFHSQIKVNLDLETRIKSVFDNSWDVGGWDKTALKTDLDNLILGAIEDHFREIHSAGKTDVRSRKVLAVLEEAPVALVEIELWDNVTNEHLLLLTNNAFEVFLHRDMNRYHTAETASALIFNPDPLTTAGVEYGDPYIDDSNRDVSVLNNERVGKDIEVTFDNGVYRLENQYVYLAEFSAPDIQPVQSPIPSFLYTRAQPGFEDVNTFYHLSVFRQYVEALGFTGLVNVPIWVDAHALNGGDQSMFTDYILGPRVFFGEGGVDDAEDADVIVHENGHALSAAAAPNTNSGHERQAVDEGIGDYLAASYSLSIDTSRWTDVFSWDGHNEFWNGRTANYAGNYQDYNHGSSIHANGQIYSTAVAKILVQLGRETTDKLLIQSLYGLAANMSMKDAAMLLYDADTALYTGENFCVIYNALLEKGLTDTFSTLACYVLDSTISAKAGDDKTVCWGDSITIGDASTFKQEYSYSWSPAAGLGSPLSLVTQASPHQTTTYVLTASKFSGAYNFDTVTVEVLQCDIRILNTEGFKYGEDLIILLPYDSDNNSVEVFDALGKRILIASHLGEHTYTLSGKLFAAGGYIVRVKAVNAKKTQKVLKLQ